jgi:hypothetical protein
MLLFAFKDEKFITYRNLSLSSFVLYLQSIKPLLTIYFYSITNCAGTIQSFITRN